MAGSSKNIKNIPQYANANGEQIHDDINKLEGSLAYDALRRHNLLTTKYRKNSIFDLTFIKPNVDKGQLFKAKVKSYFWPPICGPCVFKATRLAFQVPAGHLQKLRDENGQYQLAGPGVHLIDNMFMSMEGKAVSVKKNIKHGDQNIVIVEQGYVGLAMDNGQPVLFPPGLHEWFSHTLEFKRDINLEDHVIPLGPYTLVTVDEGYAAVTQNNGKQVILSGGHNHLLDHKNWKFEKFMSLKIQTDNLEEISATSADNIIMIVTSTVVWRIIDVQTAAVCAAETMAMSGVGEVVTNIEKLRRDVLKQAIASLAAFIGSVNYSDSFHMAAAAHETARMTTGVPVDGAAASMPASAHHSGDNPMFDSGRMQSAVMSANKVTHNYGIDIISINIISANPKDTKLSSALASGAVASAKALQAETQANGEAKALKISSEAAAEALRISAQAEADADRILAQGKVDAANLIEQSEVAVDLAKIDASAKALGSRDKFFFAKDPGYMSNVMLRPEDGGATTATTAAAMDD